MIHVRSATGDPDDDTPVQVTPVPDDLRTRTAHLHSIVRAMGSISRMLTARGTYPFQERGLGRRQMDVLFFIAQSDGLTVGALAERMRVTSGAVSQALDSLRQADIVTVTINPDDGRERIVSLTPAAADEVSTFQDAYIRAMAGEFDALDSVELAQLDGLLAKLLGQAP